ncbi:MAG: hypothetical protein RIM80_05640, partial [Alphaproteobacteria bacterium]
MPQLISASGWTVRTKILSGFLFLAALCGACGIIGALSANSIGDDGVHVAERLAPLGDAAMEIK